LLPVAIKLKNNLTESKMKLNDIPRLLAGLVLLYIGRNIWLFECSIPRESMVVVLDAHGQHQIESNEKNPFLILLIVAGFILYYYYAFEKVKRFRTAAGCYVASCNHYLIVACDNSFYRDYCFFLHLKGTLIHTIANAIILCDNSLQ